MTNSKKVVLLIFTLAFISCSSIRNQTKKDVGLTKTDGNFTFLTGCHTENSLSSQILFRLLTNSKDQFDTTFSKYSVCISPINKRHLQVNLNQDSSILSSHIIKVRYSNGSFKKRRWKSKFMFGPVFWSLTDQLTQIGINKENELVVICTTGGQLMFFFFPFMAAQGGDVVYKYHWTRKK